MINNDVTVDNYTSSSTDILSNPVRNASIENRMISNTNSSLRNPLAPCNRQSTSLLPQHANTSSSASDDFFPRQLIAVSDDPPSTTNQRYSLDNDGSSTNDQAMELLGPTTLSSQRY